MNPLVGGKKRSEAKTGPKIDEFWEKILSAKLFNFQASADKIRSGASLEVLRCVLRALATSDNSISA